MTPPRPRMTLGPRWPRVLIAMSLPMIALLLGSLPASAQDSGAAPQAAAETRPDPGIHADLDALLREHVNDGVVDYTGLARQPERLDRYLATLASVNPEELDREARIALWVNAYNAFTLQLILDNLGEIESIRDISSGKRWKAERWKVGGRTLSLDAIEHEILRPMGEPRIHFAIVCASFSCPDLRAEAYLPETLDEQLTDATEEFLANGDKGLKTTMESGFFGGDDPNVYVSKIFDWFEEDFEQDGGDVLSFVLAYAQPDAVAFIREHRDDIDVEHLDYDWSLNGK